MLILIDSILAHYGLIMDQLGTHFWTHYNMLWTQCRLIMDLLAMEPNGLNMNSLWTHYGPIKNIQFTHYGLIPIKCCLIKNVVRGLIGKYWSHYGIIVKIIVKNSCLMI